jgi:hypothetical protein
VPRFHALRGAAVACFLAAGSAIALADPGDLHRVAAERANLRGGPSEDANVRGQLARGDELVELRREGGWYGVRLLRTGEEGWVFGDLVERVAQSTLGGEGDASAGFREYSESFDEALHGLEARFGHPVVREVRRAEGDVLQVVPDPGWLLATSRDTHLATALAVYEMWKNRQKGAPVRVVLLEGEQPYIAVTDEAEGPRWTVREP